MVVVELVQYRLKQGANEQAFIETFESVLKNFLEKQPGFLKPWEIFKSENGMWTEIVRWKTMEQAIHAADPAIHGPCQEFFSYMDTATETKSFSEEKKRFV
jgi:hypothetical protein